MRKRKLFIVSILVSIAAFFKLSQSTFADECKPSVNTEMDSQSYEHLLDGWRNYAIDLSVKERARATMTCLQRAAIANNIDGILDWLLKPASLGVRESLLQFGIFSVMATQEVTNGENTRDKAVQLLFPLATQGDAEANFVLGLVLYSYSENSITTTLALEFLNLASQTGSTEARELLSNHKRQSD